MEDKTFINENGYRAIHYLSKMDVYENEIITTPNTIKHEMRVLAHVCRYGISPFKKYKKTSNCMPISFLLDTGSDKTLISMDMGIDIGFERYKDDTLHYVRDAQAGKIPYVLKKSTIHVSKNIVFHGLIGWVQKRTFELDILGMDFFRKYKLVVIGNKKKFYITEDENCIKCSKKH